MLFNNLLLIYVCRIIFDDCLHLGMFTGPEGSNDREHPAKAVVNDVVRDKNHASIWQNISQQQFKLFYQRK